MTRLTKLASLLLAFGLVAQPKASAQAFTFSTVAGAPGKGTADGTGAAAQFNFPGGTAYDSAGNVFVADTYNHCIRKVEVSTGIVTTYAGTAGASGSADGTGAAASFKYPTGLTLDSSGNLYVSDTGNFIVRKIANGGVVTTLAGHAGTSGWQDGIGTAAYFSNLQGIAVDNANGFLYIADTGNHIIRRVLISTAAVSTLAGEHSVIGDADGVGLTASFASPTGIAVDSKSKIWVTDMVNQTVRLVFGDGTVITMAGLSESSGYVDGGATTARFKQPMQLSVGPGNVLYIADLGNGAIRRFNTTTMQVSTLGSATLAYPRATAVDASGNVYVANTGLHSIRKITSLGVNTLLAGREPVGSADGVGSAASFTNPEAVSVAPTGVVFIADTANHLIRKVALDGTVSTLAGTAGVSGSADGVAALFKSPSGILADKLGNVFVADTLNHTIRKVGVDGLVSTFAGTAGAKGTTNGTGAAARFNEPKGLAMDAAGNLFVADSKNQTIRKITPAGVVSTFAGGAAVAGSLDGTGTAARFNAPTGLGIDASGNLFVTDRLNGTVRKITSAGVVTTFAGSAGNFGNADATGTSARFHEPVGIAVDSSNNVFVSDIYYNNIRKITPARLTSTVSGSPWLTDQATVLNFLPYGGDVDGADTVATFYHSYGLAFDGASLYVLDRGNDLLRKGAALVDPLAPVITTQPVSQNVVSGDPASFTVVTSAAAPTYQWKKNGVDIPTATSATYTIPAAAASDEGSYSVVVTDGGKSTASYAGILRIVTLPVIVTQPLTKTVNQGATASFTVKATGLFLTYQWKNGVTSLTNDVHISGATSATLTINNCGALDDDSYTVDVTNAAGTVTSLTVDLNVNIPAAITVPPSHSIQPKNGSATFSVVATGTNLVYQWYKGTTAIKASVNPSAITPTLSLTNVQSTDAVTYKVVVKNTLASPSASATLVVVDQTTISTQDVVAGKNAVLTPRAYGTITGYQWKYNGGAITSAGSPAHYSGFLAKSLTVIKAVDPSTSATNDEGAFTCVVTSPAGNLETSAINLRVLIPPVVNTPVITSPIMVSEFFTFTATALNDPAKFTISGLPAGVTYNGITGVVSGRPTKAGNYSIKITASNAAGSSPLPVVTVPLVVNLLTPAAQGTYQGPVTRSNSVLLGDDLGGRITLTVPNTGYCTGTLKLGKSSYSFKGPLNTTAASGPQASAIIIDNKTGTDYRINFTINTATRSLTGSVDDGAVSGATFTAGGNTGLEAWLPTATPGAIAGNYTMAMTHAIAGDDKPQGYSYGAFKVSATGLATGSLKMADGSAVVFSSVPVGDAGSFPIFTLLYSNTGSVHGKINIDTASSNKLDGSVLGWTKKLQTVTTRYFHNGFGPLDLTSFGRNYVIPSIAMGLTPGAGNAKLLFTDDPAPTIASRLDVNPFEIKSGNPSPVVLPVGVTGVAVIGSHAKTSLAVTPGSGTTFTAGTTGSFSGTMILVDQDPTVVPVKPVTRTNKFYGMIVDDGATKKGYGFHVFQTLGSAAATGTTTPYHSAKVVLSSAP